MKTTEKQKLGLMENTAAHRNTSIVDKLPPITRKPSSMADKALELRRVFPLGIGLTISVTILAGGCYYLMITFGDFLEDLFYSDGLDFMAEHYMYLPYILMSIAAILWGTLVTQVVKPVLIEVYNEGIYFNQNNFYLPFERLLSIKIKRDKIGTRDSHEYMQRLEFCFAGTQRDTDLIKHAEEKHTDIPGLCRIYYSPPFYKDTGLNYKFDDFIMELTGLHALKAAPLKELLGREI